MFAEGLCRGLPKVFDGGPDPHLARVWSCPSGGDVGILTVRRSQQAHPRQRQSLVRTWATSV